MRMPLEISRSTKTRFISRLYLFCQNNAWLFVSLFVLPLIVAFYVKVATKQSLMVSTLSVSMDNSEILCPFILDILFLLILLNLI
jgi:hypothetical protein